MTATHVNGRWWVDLPPHRAARPEWPTWERERLAAMHDAIEQGDVVYDIGAEEGDFAALFATWGARLVLVEPNPKAWPNIRWTWEANKLPAPLAWHVGLLGEHHVIATDPDADDQDVDGWPACAYDELIGDHGFRHLGEHGGIGSSIITLDELVDATGVPPDVVTMDVEGGELYVLRGGDATLSEHHPTVFVSIHPEFMDNLYGIGDGVEAVCDLMAGHGYTGTFLAHDHEHHWMFQ